MSEPTAQSQPWKAEERRAQILEVARKCFASKGFAQTTVEEIAAQAGVTKLAVYEHFGGKEGLYAIIIDQVITGLASVLREAMAHIHLSSHDLLKGTIRALLDYIEDCPQCMQLIMMDFSEMGGFGAASILSDTTAQLEVLLLPAYEITGFDTKVIPLVAQAMTGMVAITGQWWLVHPEFSKEEVVDQLVDMIWNGIHHIGLEAGTV